MILDGRSIVDKRLIALGDPDILEVESQVQPNGVDLRLDKLYEVHGKVQVPAMGKVKHELQITELTPKDNWFQIKPTSGNVYYADFLESANIADGFSAQLFTRSSLVRAGVDVVSGLWDTGFQGQLGCCLRFQAPIDLEWGSKLCQIVVSQSEFNGVRYTGRYQSSNSQTAITS